jgi:hypothetical protein
LACRAKKMFFEKKAVVCNTDSETISSSKIRVPNF